MQVSSRIYMLGPLGPPPPDLDELLRWVEGKEAPMPLRDEEKARIREIEAIRAEAHQEAMSRARAFFDAPVAGDCTACGRLQRMNWRFCPFCGAPSSVGCPRCHMPLPREDGVQFCPQCGGRV
jgi:RNA polymerase subunit RPABC4/transcription elongation factor Spt4